MGEIYKDSLIYVYLKRFQEDPKSRIFAPLAEAYRKAGLIDEAIQIAREGLKTHPGFMGGRVALARALFDKKLFQEVIEELKSIVQDVPDNLIAQKLLAESSLMLGHLADALNAYKMFLYFAPHDEEVAKIIQELEVQSYEQGVLVLTSEPASNFIHYEKKTVEMRVQKIEFLQNLLQKIERYRAHLVL